MEIPPPPDSARPGGGNLGVTGAAAAARTKGAARIVARTQRDAPALHRLGLRGAIPGPNAALIDTNLRAVP